MKRALFSGLIFDENGNPVEGVYVGQDSCYVIDDHGFKKHILSELVDRQVLDQMRSMVEGNEELISKQTAKMLGQEDIFTYAMIANQLKNMDEQFDKLLETGIPDEAKSYMGMMGFKIIINIHGDVIKVDQPGIPPGDED